MKQFLKISLCVLGWLTALFLVHSFVPKGNEFLSWLSGFGAGFGGLTGAATIAGVFFSKSVKEKAEIEKETVELQSAMSPVRQAFITALHEIFADAVKSNAPSVTVNAGKLHRLVGGYPVPKNRMSVCCSVMYAEMQEGRDEIVESPPEGKGASVTIKYQLPR